MPWRLCCYGMCKILWWSFGKQSNTRIKLFVSELNYGRKVNNGVLSRRQYWWFPTLEIPRSGPTWAMDTMGIHVKVSINTHYFGFPEMISPQNENMLLQININGLALKKRNSIASAPVFLGSFAKSLLFFKRCWVKSCVLKRTENGNKIGT